MNVTAQGFFVACRNVHSGGAFSCLAARSGLFLAFGLAGLAILAPRAHAGLVFRAGNSPGQLGSGDAYVSAAIGEQGILGLKRDGTVSLLEAKEGSAHFQIPRTLTNAVAVAALGNAAGALRVDGKVVTWGSYSRPAPAGLSNVVAIAVGGDVILALGSDGSVAAWSDSNARPPASVPPGLRDVVAVSTSWTYNGCLALRADGTVTAWDSALNAPDFVPAEATNVVAIAAALRQNFALRADGTVIGWWTIPGQDNPVSRTPFYPFPNATGIVDIAAGPDRVLALTADGRVLDQNNGDLGFSNAVFVSPVDARGFMVVTGDGSPVVVNEPPDTVAFSGEKLRLVAKVGGVRPLTLQWSRDGNPIPGATNAILMIHAVQSSDAGRYQLTASNAGGRSASRIAHVRILESAPIVRRVSLEPTAHTLYPGGSATLSVEVSGAAPLRFQWQLEGAPIRGATNQTLVLEKLRLEDRGQYSVTVSNAAGVSTSSPIRLKISPLVMWGNPIIRAHGIPASATNLVAVTSSGTDNTALRADGTVVVWGLAEDYAELNPPSGLSNVVAVASGGGVIAALKADGRVTGWGWNYSALNIPSSLSNIVAIALTGNSLAALRNDGAVLVFGDNPAARRAVVGLDDAVALSNWGGLALRSNGTVVSFSNDALLPGPLVDLTYAVAIALGRSSAQAIMADGSIVQWGTIYDVNLVPPPADIHDYIAVSNGGDSVLALRANGDVVGWGANGQRQASVPADLHGVAAISAGYTHSMAIVDDGPPRIFQHPLSVHGFIGSNARLVAGAFGAPPLRYQWRVDGLAISGATNSVLALDDLSFFDAGTYEAVVSNKHGQVTSHPASIEVEISPPVHVTAQIDPATGTALIGGRVLLSAHAEGTGPFSYRWFHEGEPIVSTAEPVLRLESIAYADAGQYWVEAANAFGSSTSAPVRLTVIDVAVWGSNYDRQLEVPASATNLAAVYAGMFHSVGLRADGTVMVWGNTPIDGGMHPGGRLQPPPGLSNFVAVAAGGGFNVALKSDGTVLGWGDNSWGQISGLTQWNNIVAVAADYAHTLALRADGTVLAKGGNFSGQIAIPPGIEDGIAITAGWEASSVLRSDGSVIQWGHGQKVPTDDRHDLVAIAPGLSLRKDGTLLGWPDATGPGLAPIVAISGSRDRQLVLRADGTAWPYDASMPPGLTNIISIAAGFQHSVALMGGGPPRLLQQPVSFTAVAGRNARFAVSASGAQPIAYQWRQNGRPIPNATNQVLALDHVSIFDGGPYDAVASNASGTSTSRVAVLTLMFQPPSALTVRAQPEGGIGYLGGSAQFTATARGSTPFEYRWLRQGQSVLKGREATLTLDHLSAADSGDYLAIAANAFGSVTSAPVHLAVVNVAAWGKGGRGFGALAVPPAANNVIALAAGVAHVVAVRADGGPLVWGIPNAGTLDIPSTVSDLRSVATSEAFTLGLRQNGSVLVWPHTDVEDTGVTHLPEGLTNVIQVAAGRSFALALREDGTVVQWGQVDDAGLPLSAGLAKVVQVAAGERHALALLRDGTVVGWGNNDYGEATPPLGLSNVVALAAGLSCSVALRDDGSVLEWGNSTGTLPAEATGLTAIAVGANHRVGLLDDGRVITWGPGVGDQNRVPEGLPPAVAIAASGDHSFAVFPATLEPHLGRQPRHQSLFTGQTLHLEVNVLPGAAPVTYQWFRNGQAVPAGNDAVLELPAVTPDDAGEYSVTVRNPFGAATSRSAQVVVSAQAPVLLEEPADAQTYEGGSVSLRVSATGSEPLAYQWLWNGVPIGGATNGVLEIALVTRPAAGQYQVTVGNALGTVISRPARLTVTPAVSLTRTELGVKSDGTCRFAVRLSSPSAHDTRVRWRFWIPSRLFSSEVIREGFLIIPAGATRQCAEVQDSALVQGMTDGRALVLTLVEADSAAIGTPPDAILRDDIPNADDVPCEPISISPARFEPENIQRRPDGAVEMVFSVESDGGFTVQASSDLVVWFPVDGTVVRDPGSSRIWFLDPQGGDRPTRFYRVRSD